MTRSRPSYVWLARAIRLKTRRVLTQMIRVSATTEPRGSTSDRTAASMTAKTTASPATNHATLTTASTLVSPPTRGAAGAGASGRLAVAWRRDGGVAPPPWARWAGASVAGEGRRRAVRGVGTTPARGCGTVTVCRRRPPAAPDLDAPGGGCAAGGPATVIPRRRT